MTRQPTAPAPSFGVDLITFFDPAYWGLADRAALAAYAAERPAAFWHRVLDALSRTGIQQLELTFAPADHRTAQAAFGSARGFANELTARGLALASGYFGDIEHATDITDADVQKDILAEAERYAAFLAEAGGRHLVTGLPMRRNAPGGSGYEPVGLRAAEPVADLVNRVAAVTARHGVRMLLHTESHTMMWNGRDVDLMMLLTDAFTVGLCLDTGHVVLSGSDPVAVAARHLDRIGLVHWKDASGPFRGTPRIDDGIFERHRDYFRPIGDGAVDWPALSALLNRRGFQECVLLELDAAPDPEAALTAARRYLESTVGAALPAFAPQAPDRMPASPPR
ncbi:sugar phosphate isomerase/epimerase family protein [Streptomyces shenzhenensis]|uniref:sugar phosphate isomerase/epimerase family protein n=1 Tax=Streptomyces shenzhenensis TaxID=943815 RepID=UPI00340375A9